LFVFDAIGRYAVADDDEAKWLTGEHQSTRKGPQPRASAKAESGRGRRLSSVPSDDDLLSFGPDEETTDDLTAVVRAVSEGDVEPERPPAPPTESREPATADDTADDTEPVETQKPDRKRRANRRASVPSWDEIMFGKGKND
ncbi:MAG: hypothetical protein M3Q82_05555, partial [Actinomycetota bacterium]|nr:hypothetical protein [Actinomycetota bacterium]